MFNFKPWQLFALGLMSSMLVCLVASYDIEQEEQDKELYCKMVAEGSWPDYKGSMIGCASPLGDDQ